MESTFFRVVLLSLISINASVFGLEDLTFFGQYVVFRPKTQFLKFDLYEEMDIVLLEHRPNRPNAELQNTDYLYRIHMIVDNSVTEGVGVNCTILRKGGHIMVKGQYRFWNETEMQGMAVSWRSEKRIIKVLTEFEGNHTDIFSWTDKTKTFTPVKYVGLAVAPVSPESNPDNSTHRHLNWNMREAEPADADIRNAYKMCNLQLQYADPSNKSNTTMLYQISITREADENFLVSLQKRSGEVLRLTSSRMDCDKVVISVDTNEKMVCFGLMGDTAPIFLWRDTEDNEYDYNNIKYIIFRHSSRRISYKIEVKKFVTFSELFPRYFSGKQFAGGENETMMSTTVKDTLTEEDTSTESMESTTGV